MELFEELLNREDTPDLPDIPKAPENLDINVEPPTKEEIVTAIKERQNRKAPGYDQLNVELFNADPELAARHLIP